MLDSTLVKMRATIKYEKPGAGAKPGNFSFSSLALDATDAQLYELMDSFGALQQPEAEGFYKYEFTDLQMME